MCHHKLNSQRGIEFEFKLKNPGAGLDIPTLEEIEFFVVRSLVFFYDKM